jgi:hypothetical protein
MRGWPVVPVVLAAMLLAACAVLPQTTADTVRLVFSGKPALGLSAADVAARPYYQLQVDSKHGEALLVLGNVDAGREAWYSAQDEIVFLQDGLLVKSWHLGTDIDTTRLPADSPFRTGLQHVRAPVESQRMVDVSPGYRYGVMLDSRLVPAGIETVDILGTRHRLLRIDEHVRSAALGFEADNRYWVDPADGFVWKSRQTIPGGLTLTLTELRVYRGGRP